MSLTKDMAQELCDSIEIYADFFDPESEEYILLKQNNPTLLDAYEELFTLANAETV